jgi:Mg2+/Co2+ transporter CorB
VTCISIICSALISFSETSVLSSSKNKILLKKKRFVKFAIRLLEKKDSVISLLLILNTLANVITSVCITALVSRFFHSGPLIIASIFSTILLLMFGEIFPKILAMKNPNDFTLIASPVIYYLLKIFYPLVFLIQVFLKIVFFLLGFKDEDQKPKFSKEIKELVEAYKIIFKKSIETNSNYDQNSKKLSEVEIKYIKMINAISNLDKITVEHVMTHRLKVFYIDIEEDEEKIIQSILNSVHSRIVICEKDIDNIIGILNVKDVLRQFKNGSIYQNLSKSKLREIIQKPMFVFENAPLLVQLENFKKENKHFGIVIDEYSVMIGIITLSDILEEIIGTIYDEYDVHKQQIKKINENEFLVSGSIPMHEFIDETDARIESYEEYTTLAAFLIDKFGYIPKESEEIKIGQYFFKILSMDDKRISKIHFIL